MKSFTLHLFVLFLIGNHQNIYSSSALATTITENKSISSSSLISSPPSESTEVILTSSLLSPKDAPAAASATAHITSETTTVSIKSATSSVASKSLQQTKIININNEKSRTARDLPIKNNIESLKSINNDSKTFNNNNELSCSTTHLQNENEKNDCIKQNHQKRQQKQQQQEQQQQLEAQQQHRQLLSKQEEQLKSLHQASQSLWHETHQSNRVRRTSKTPRTIQRLIAGHLTLSNNAVASTSRIETTSNISEKEPQTSTIKTESIPKSQSTPPIRKPFRSRSYGNVVRKKISMSTTTTTGPKLPIKQEYYDNDKKDDDEAFLEDTKEIDNWDNGILRLSAGDGKEDKIKSKKKLDPNKTLSEQVKDGKYGLIEQEIFKRRPKRPGILSYLQNKEFPHDNEKTLGGLQEDDIWLAEDHLLVIKGGGLNDNDKNEPWAPIDDYIEPDRPIKIPDNPKIPPPFPIQLGENEPIQFVGDNQITFGSPSLINESSGATLSIYSAGDEDKNQIENSEDSDKKNFASGKGSNKGTTKLESIPNVNNAEEGYFYPRGNPAWSIQNGTLINPFLNFRPFDFPAVPPNGSVDDILDQIDEDDASLYYPPPYSFVYKSNYTNPVPAGPLVPGIVLPPPPNAFSRLETETTTKKRRPSQHPSFRQKLTRLQQYKPKTIVITPDPITSTKPITSGYSTSVKSATSTTSTSTTLSPLELELNKEVIYAQTPPSYGKVRYYTPSNRIHTTSTTIKTPTEPAPVEEIISFVPQVEAKRPKDNDLSLQKPIYYEYYDMKPTPSPTPEVYYKEMLPPTIPPSPTIPLQHPTSPLPQPIPQSPSSRPTTTLSGPNIKEYTTGKYKQSKITTIKPVLRKSHKHYSPQGKTYLTPRPSYHFDDYVNIKPQPEIRPNGIAQYDIPLEPAKPIYNSKSVPEFDREVNSIRQTLQFFDGQEEPFDYHQSTHKPKPIYEYSFDATRRSPTTPKPQFDTNPFQPMVKYSLPVDDVNGFRAITYPKINDQNYYNVLTDTPESQKNENDPIRVQIIYDSTPRPENGLYSNNPQQATHSTPIQSQNPWISIEKQVVQEIGSNGLPITTRVPSKRRPSSRKIEQVPNNNKFDGYFYDPPPSHQVAASQVQRTNNRYYEEPFAKHLYEIRKKLGAEHPHLQQQWNLLNATNSNYVTLRPQNLNQQSETYEQYLREQKSEENTTPVKPSHWSTENNKIAINPTSEDLHQQKWIHQQQQQQQQQVQQPTQLWSLESDINVNNIPYGRPPINPDSEFIEPIRQTSLRKPHRQKYRDASKLVKPNAEPFKQYLREVTLNENFTPSESQKLWAVESHTNEPYSRTTLNRHGELMEQSTRPSHHYRHPEHQQQQQQQQRINGAESFKQYLRKIAVDKNYNPHPVQVWTLENNSTDNYNNNNNKVPLGRSHINSNGEFLPPPPPPQLQPQRRPIYRENFRELSPPSSHILQQQQQQPQQHSQQKPCKWPHNCNSHQNGGILPGHSLHSDVNINYGQKLPPINPNSEFINPYQPYLNEYKPQQQQQQQLQQQQRHDPRPIYNRPRPQIDSSNRNNNYYHQEPQFYQNSNNQRQQRPPK